MFRKVVLMPDAFNLKSLKAEEYPNAELVLCKEAWRGYGFEYRFRFPNKLGIQLIKEKYGTGESEGASDNDWEARLLKFSENEPYGYRMIRCNGRISTAQLKSIVESLKSLDTDAVNRLCGVYLN